jgi:hypothetical protein
LVAAFGFDLGDPAGDDGRVGAGFQRGAVTGECGDAVGLKFSAALPKRLAVATLAARLADLDGAAAILKEPSRYVSDLSR